MTRCDLILSEMALQVYNHLIPDIKSFLATIAIIENFSVHLICRLRLQVVSPSCQMFPNISIAMPFLFSISLGFIFFSLYDYASFPSAARLIEKRL